MSVLSKQEITQYIKSGKLKFAPVLDGFQLQPHAVDLRLGYSFHIPKTWCLTKHGRKALKIDPFSKNCTKDNYERVEIKDGQYFELLPKEFVLATTLEQLEINTGDLMGVLYPRSSINRRGLSVDLSGIIDVWYKGYLMIPIINNTETQTIRIYPGERICQVTFQKLSSDITKKDGMVHGLAKAKYTHKKNGSILGKQDKEDELNLIRAGKVTSLKRKYKVIF